MEKRHIAMFSPQPLPPKSKFLLSIYTFHMFYATKILQRHVNHRFARKSRYGIPLRVSSHYTERYMLFFHIPQFAYPRCLPFRHQAVYLSSATIASRRATSSSVNSGKCPLFAFDNEPPFCCTKRINWFALFSGISTTLRIPNLMRS